MKVRLLDQQIYFIQENSSTLDDVITFTKQSSFYQNPYSIIVELSEIENDFDVTTWSLVQKKLQKLKLILVLVSKCETLDFFSDNIICVPTLAEAIDYIQFDRIQKKLLD